MIEKVLHDIGLTPRQQEIVLERLAGLLLNDPQQSDVVVKITDYLLKQADEDHRKSGKSEIFVRDATVTVEIGDEAVSEKCRQIKISKNGEVIGWAEDGSMIVTHITRAVIRKKGQGQVQARLPGGF